MVAPSSTRRGCGSHWVTQFHFLRLVVVPLRGGPPQAGEDFGGRGLRRVADKALFAFTGTIEKVAFGIRIRRRAGQQARHTEAEVTGQPSSSVVASADQWNVR